MVVGDQAVSLSLLFPAGEFSTLVSCACQFGTTCVVERFLK